MTKPKYTKVVQKSTCCRRECERAAKYLHPSFFLPVCHYHLKVTKGRMLDGMKAPAIFPTQKNVSVVGSVMPSGTRHTKLRSVWRTWEEPGPVTVRKLAPVV